MPLIEAIENNDLDGVRAALDAGEDVNTVQNGHAALHIAFGRRFDGNEFSYQYDVKIEIARLLIERGANLNYTDGINWTPLTYAINSESKEIFDLLLERLPIEQLNEITEDIPLHDAAAVGNLYMLQRLLQKGCDPTRASQVGYTSLHLCVGSGDNKEYPEIARELLKVAPELLHKKDKWGCTALHLAYDSPSAMSVLLNAGANPNALCNEKKSPLIHLCMYQRFDPYCTLLLLNAGAQIDATLDEETPLEIAIRRNQPEMAHVIIEKLFNTTPPPENLCRDLINILVTVDDALETATRAASKRFLETLLTHSLFEEALKSNQAIKGQTPSILGFTPSDYLRIRGLEHLAHKLDKLLPVQSDTSNKETGMLEFFAAIGRTVVATKVNITSLINTGRTAQEELHDKLSTTIRLLPKARQADLAPYAEKLHHFIPIESIRERITYANVAGELKLDELACMFPKYALTTQNGEPRRLPTVIITNMPGFEHRFACMVVEDAELFEAALEHPQTLIRLLALLTQRDFNKQFHKISQKILTKISQENANAEAAPSTSTATVKDKAKILSDFLSDEEIQDNEAKVRTLITNLVVTYLEDGEPALAFGMIATLFPEAQDDEEKDNLSTYLQEAANDNPHPVKKLEALVQLAQLVYTDARNFDKDNLFSEFEPAKQCIHALTQAIDVANSYLMDAPGDKYAEDKRQEALELREFVLHSATTFGKQAINDAFEQTVFHLIVLHTPHSLTEETSMSALTLNKIADDTLQAGLKQTDKLGMSAWDYMALLGLYKLEAIFIEKSNSQRTATSTLSEDLRKQQLSHLIEKLTRGFSLLTEAEQTAFTAQHPTLIDALPEFAQAADTAKANGVLKKDKEEVEASEEDVFASSPTMLTTFSVESKKEKQEAETPEQSSLSEPTPKERPSL